MAMLISGSKSDCRDRSVEHCKKARQSLCSKTGRRLMRLRGQQIERSFAHILDCGGMRKAALRGQVNLQKRYLFAAACYNLSQLLRKKFGCGTLKMALATTLTRLLHHGLILRALLQRVSENFVCGSQREIKDGSDQEEGARRAGPGRQEAGD